MNFMQQELLADLDFTLLHWQLLEKNFIIREGGKASGVTEGSTIPHFEQSCLQSLLCTKVRTT